MSEQEEIYICPNCKKENPDKAKYCLNCGQKIRPLRVKIWEFISEFMDAIFNIDNRFFKTIIYLFIPAKLTNAYFRGERQKFYHPLRIYVVLIIIFFAILSFLGVENVIKVGDSVFNINTNIGDDAFSNEQLVSLNSMLDSLSDTNPGIKDFQETFNENFIEEKSFTDSIENLKKSGNELRLISKGITISAHELLEADIDSVVGSKNLDLWIDKLILRQILKGARDIDSLNSFIYANLTWLFIALIPLFAIVLKFFYLRRNRYYLEHVVFLLHLFSGLLLFICICLPFGLLENSKGIVATVIATIAVLYPLSAMKSFYKQGRFKTFVKFIFTGFIFVLIFFTVFLIFVVLAAALF